jgi:CarD family transcriptional regulator
MAKQAKFKPGDHVVYPAHGVGMVTTIETREVAGLELEMLVIEFDKEKMTLRIPVGKIDTAGLRGLASKKDMQDALKTLKGRVRIKRTMWSRRAQEYEAKINSGSLVQIAEVVRDLYRNADQPDQSYSERQIYQAALERLVRELAAVERVDEEKALAKVEDILSTASPTAAAIAAAEAEAEDGDADAETDIEAENAAA